MKIISIYWKFPSQTLHFCWVAKNVNGGRFCDFNIDESHIFCWYILVAYSLNITLYHINPSFTIIRASPTFKHKFFVNFFLNPFFTTSFIKTGLISLLFKRKSQMIAKLSFSKVMWHAYFDLYFSQPFSNECMLFCYQFLDLQLSRMSVLLHFF